ncbi:MAG: hypothetical protein AAF063_12505 [Cyanobacteria bacterium J06643_5]
MDIVNKQMKTLAEELLEQLMLFKRFKHLDDETLKKIMNNPELAEKFDKTDSDNLAV